MKKPTQQFSGPDGHRKRLRERFLNAGSKAIADYELLELLLTYSIPRVDTKPIAKALLNKFGSILSVFQQPSERLLQIKGVGPQTTTLIRVVQACMTRSLEKSVEQQQTISGPEDVFSYIRLHLAQHTNECIFALHLNDKKQVIHRAEISVGTVNRAPFYPREIIKPALIHNATGLILAHNHPEGGPVPSEADLVMTKRLEEVAEPLGIKILDHMVVTGLQAYSIKTGKLMP